MDTQYVGPPIAFVGILPRYDVAVWVAAELRRQGIDATTEPAWWRDGWYAGVRLQRHTDQDRFADLLNRLPRPLPTDIELLGQHEGITYGMKANGDVWRCVVHEWDLFATATDWPLTATAAALQDREDA